MKKSEYTEIKLFMVIEKLDKPREYDGVTKVRWGTTDDFEYLKKICSFMLDSNPKYLKNIYVWFIYSKDKYDEIPLLEFCEEHNITSMHSQCAWAKK